MAGIAVNSLNEVLNFKRTSETEAEYQQCLRIFKYQVADVNIDSSNQIVEHLAKLPIQAESIVVLDRTRDTSVDRFSV